MTSNTIYHYVYRITNLVEKKHYYGKRSSKVDPKQDLGIKYFSSSRDKEFREDQKLNPLNYRYKIVQQFISCKAAIIRESKLHSKFNVGANPKFYNKATQTINGFDRTGVVMSLEDRIKMSKAKIGYVTSEETKIKLSKLALGRIVPEEIKIKISKSSKGRIVSEETRAKIAKAATGRIMSKETRAKMSESMKGKK